MRILICFLALGMATASLGQVADKADEATGLRVAELIRDLGADSFQQREAAAKGLLEIGGPALAALRQAAKSKDAEVQYRALVLVKQVEAIVVRQERDKELVSLRKELTPDFRGLKPALDHAGALTDSEIWKADKTHRVTGLVTVPEGKTLTIEPGAVVLLADKADLVISRKAMLVARSEKDAARIMFASTNAAEGKDGPGGQIRVLGGGVEFQNVLLYGTRGIELKEATKGDLRSVSIVQTTGTALAVTQCSPTVERLTIIRADGDGIALIGGTGRFRNVRVLDTRLGIRFDKRVKSQSAGQWTDVAVLGAAEEGLLLAGGSVPTLEEVTVAGCKTGMRMVGQSYPRVRSAVFKDCRSDGIVVDDGSYPTLEKIEVSDVEGVGLLIQGNSYPTIGALNAMKCKQGDQVVEAGSRYQRPAAETSE